MKEEEIPSHSSFIRHWPAAPFISTLEKTFIQGLFVTVLDGERSLISRQVLMISRMFFDLKKKTNYSSSTGNRAWRNRSRNQGRSKQSRWQKRTLFLSSPRLRLRLTCHQFWRVRLLFFPSCHLITFDLSNVCLESFSPSLFSWQITRYPVSRYSLRSGFSFVVSIWSIDETLLLFISEIFEQQHY